MVKAAPDNQSPAMQPWLSKRATGSPELGQMRSLPAAPAKNSAIFEWRDQARLHHS